MSLQSWELWNTRIFQAGSHFLDIFRDIFRELFAVLFVVQNKMFDPAHAVESTPLLSREGRETTTSGSAYVSFRRSALPIRSKDGHQPSLRPTLGDHRTSVRGSVAGPHFPSLEEKSLSKTLENSQVQPLDALAPLVAGGVIHSPISGYRTQVRGERTIKSLPAFAPFRRTARHRSFYLWWVNEFRHWWKSRCVWFCRVSVSQVPC
jgi:hypothetical protein